MRMQQWKNRCGDAGLTSLLASESAEVYPAEAL